MTAPEPTTRCNERLLWLSPVGHADHAHYVRTCRCHFWQRVENVAAISLAAEIKRQRQHDAAARKARQRNRMRRVGGAS